MTENNSKDVIRRTPEERHAFYATARKRRNARWTDMMAWEIARVKIMTTGQAAAFLQSNTQSRVSVNANHVGMVMGRLAKRGVVVKTLDVGARTGLALYHYVEPEVDWDNLI